MKNQLLTSRFSEPAAVPSVVLASRNPAVKVSAVASTGFRSLLFLVLLCVVALPLAVLALVSDGVRDDANES